METPAPPDRSALTYDALNRTTLSMGVFNGTIDESNRGSTSGSIILGANSHQIGYTRDHQRAWTRSQSHLERYIYDDQGHLSVTKLGNAYLNGVAVDPYASDNGLVRRAERTNDAFGFTTRYQEFDSTGNVATRDIRTTYYGDGRARVTGAYGSSDTTTYSYDAAGNLLTSVSQQGGVTDTTRTAYELWDDYKQYQVYRNGKTTQPLDTKWEAGTGSYRYDVNGHIRSATDHYAGRRFLYSSSAQGQVLERLQTSDGTRASLQQSRRYYYLNGLGIGEVGTDGPAYIDYAARLAKQPPADPYRPKPVFSADFDANYVPVGPDKPGQVPGSYTVQSGDTLQGIARSLWGDGTLWYLLAEANALLSNEPLTAGRALVVPNVVTNVHNTSQTFRPYDAGRALGDTMPTLPDMPPPPIEVGDGGCGAKQVLVAVIVVVATILTAGAMAMAMAGALGTLGGMGFGAAITALGTTGVTALTAGGWAAVGIGLAAGTVGSVVGQAAGVAMGLQDSINWKQAALNGVTTAVTAGIAGPLGDAVKIVGSGWGQAALQAVGNNVVGQGVNMALGQQDHFDWRGVATSAVSAGVTSALGGTDTAVGRALRTDKVSWTAQAAKAVTSSVIAEGVRTAVYGAKFDWVNVASSTANSTIYSYYGAAYRQAQLGQDYGFDAAEAWGSVNEDGSVTIHYDDGEPVTVGGSSGSREGQLFAGDVRWRGGEANSGSGLKVDMGESSADELRDLLQSDPAMLKTFNTLVADGKSAADALTIADGVHSLSSDKAKLDVYAAARDEILHRVGASEGDAIEAGYDASRFVDTKRRVDDINGLIKSGAVSGEDLVRLQKESQVLTADILAKDSYFKYSLKGIMPDGITRVRAFDQNNSSGLFAALYANSNDNGGAHNILAFRGTESGAAGGLDWANNVLQQAGFNAPQFTESVDLARKQFRSLGGDLSFVGHSLGGGLAAAAALVTGGQAITFNAEGLSRSTISNLQLDASHAASQITAFNVEGELLTVGQSRLMRGVINTIGTPLVNIGAFGKTVNQLVHGEVPTMDGYGIAAMGDTQGTHVVMPAVDDSGALMPVMQHLSNTVNLHFMTSVNNSLQYWMRNNGHLPDEYLQNIQIRRY